MAGCKRDSVDCKYFTCKLEKNMCGIECETTSSLCSLCKKTQCSDEIMKMYIKKKIGGEEMKNREISGSVFTEILYRHRHMKDNLFDLRQLAPTHHHHKIMLLLNFGSGHQDPNVPDPYYGGDEGFEHMMDLIEDAAEGLLRHIQTQHL